MDVSVVHGQSPRGYYRVDLCGEMDLTAAPEVRTALTGAKASACRDVLLELSRLTFLDIMGAHLLGEFLEVTREREGRLIVRKPTRWVTRTLEVTGLARDVYVEQTALHVRPAVGHGTSGDWTRRLN